MTTDAELVALLLAEARAKREAEKAALQASPFERWGARATYFAAYNEETRAKRALDAAIQERLDIDDQEQAKGKNQ